MTQPAPICTPDAISELLSEIRDRGVSVWIHHNKLFFRDAHTALTQAQTDLLLYHEDEILTRLALQEPPADRYDTFETAESFDVAPLTFQQQSAIAYREPYFYGIFAVRLRGCLNVNALSKSIESLVRSHDALRSRVVVLDGVPRQEIPRNWDEKLRVELPVQAENDEADRHVNQRIDSFVTQWLTSGLQTFEARLIPVTIEEHVLVVAWDHLFQDYISVTAAFAELWTSYRGFCRSADTTPQRRPMQYSEYARWQRSTYSKWIEVHGSFWQNRLSDAQSLVLKSDSTSGEIRPLEERTLSIQLAASVSASIHAFAQNQKVLPALVVLSICICLLFNWSHQQEFVLPFYVLGRHSSRHFQIVGYMAHPLPLRVSLHRSQSFLELLRDVAGEFMEASEHLANGRSLPEAPNPFEAPLIQWFDSAPNAVEALVPPTGWSSDDTGLSVTAFPPAIAPPTEAGTLESVPLFVSLWNSPAGIAGNGFYRSDLFSHESVLGFVNGLSAVSELIVADAQVSLGELMRHTRFRSQHHIA